MNMVVGNKRDSGVRLRETRPTEDERVRDFDQLDRSQQRDFLRLYRDQPVDPSIRSDTVISFTDYYRVERF